MNINLVGKKVKNVRKMTEKEEFEMFGQVDRQPTTCLEFMDGTILVPSRDYEGNGPGVYFGATKEGQLFALSAR